MFTGYSFPVIILRLGLLPRTGFCTLYLIVYRSLRPSLLYLINGSMKYSMICFCLVLISAVTAIPGLIETVRPLARSK